MKDGRYQFSFTGKAVLERRRQGSRSSFSSFILSTLHGPPASVMAGSLAFTTCYAPLRFGGDDPRGFYAALAAEFCVRTPGRTVVRLRDQRALLGRQQTLEALQGSQVNDGRDVVFDESAARRFLQEHQVGRD